MNASSQPFLTPDEAITQLEALYQQSVAALRDSISEFIASGTLPEQAARQQGLFVYPELRVCWDGEHSKPVKTRAYGRFTHSGCYTTTITRPELFGHYLKEQLNLLYHDYDAQIEVRLSAHEIPYPYVIDGSDLALDRSMSAGLARHFPTTELAQIGDETADGLFHPTEAYPLSHFDARRVDFSLARLRHYTGTPVEHFQPFVLFTNYNRYVDEFISWACEQIIDPDSPYIALSCAGGGLVTADTQQPELAVSDLAWKKHQMPAYHLLTKEGQGITLINIGVGPSNAKTICDHLAVLRPAAWLMIGHCGGLRESQQIGDYVLAHAYLRDDHVLDTMLPPDIPIPSIAEVQRALYDATKEVSGMPGEAVKQRLRTGTVVTTDDRNWELRYSASALRFNLSRAVAIDMESATIAAQGYRFRVPYGTLLCVSDKPLHGEIKLPGQANRFYEGAISEHLQIGIRAIDLLRAEGERLHSRKLRTFNEPPFR
ncbi:AMP nucleosidase [Salmonella enterica subsp. enterica serovar Choleraesuis]|nr:AMP nucleosidase [Salmonella enterica subsp. enterica serovar Choleraesuis]